jgi:hypothetical protein
VLVGSEVSGSIDNSEALVIAGSTSTIMASDSFFGTGAGVSMVVPEPFKLRAEEEVHTRNNKELLLTIMDVEI